MTLNCTLFIRKHLKVSAPSLTTTTVTESNSVYLAVVLDYHW